MGKGDHIKVKRGMYWHHGIDMGDGTVVHFTGEPTRKRHAAIRRTSMEKFLRGGRLEVVEYAKSYCPEVVVSRAMSRLAERGYHLALKNCEHFARWCKTGEARSQQVRVVASAAGGLAGTAGVARAAMGAVSLLGPVKGRSGAGIMSGLARVAGGHPAHGLAKLASLATEGTCLAVKHALWDDDKLPRRERRARAIARIGTRFASKHAPLLLVGLISRMGKVRGLSAAGMSSGLRALGRVVGGGMAAGTGLSFVLSAVATAAIGFGLYGIYKRFF